MRTSFARSAVVAVAVTHAVFYRAAMADVPEPSIPTQMTLASALRSFRATGYDLLVAEAQVQSARGDVLAAGAIPNPSLSGGLYRSFFRSGLYETGTGWFLGIGDSNAIEETISGKRRLRLDVAEAALRVAALKKADAQRVLELAVAEQYIQVLLAKSARNFAGEVAVAAAKLFELHQVRYRTGAISEVDLAKSETAKLEAEQAVDTAEAQLAQAKVNLAYLLGARGRTPAFDVDEEELRYAVPKALAGLSLEALLDRASTTRPDLASQREQRERATAGVLLARRLRVPDVGLNVQYQQEGSGHTAANEPAAITPPTLQLSLSMTLPLFYRQKGEILRAEADVRSQDAQLAKDQAQAVSDVTAAFEAYQSSRRLVERMEGRLLERARRARDLIEFQYHKGAASLLEYLDAERTYIAANLEYLQELASYWTAVFQLEAAAALEIER